MSGVQIMAVALCLFFSKSPFKASFLRKQVNNEKTETPGKPTLSIMSYFIYFILP